MREFYLINGKGNTYSLTDKLHWLYEPENLGAKFNSKYEQIGSNFIRTQRIARPDDISGKILFTGGNPYSDYHNFIKFIAAEPLILEYFNNNDRFRAKVDLKEIKKAEINSKTGFLECPIKLKRTSRWYKTITALNDASSQGGKVYDYSYPYTYLEFEPQQAIIESDSGYESPIKLTIFGPCTNPTWKHYLNDEVIGYGALNTSIIAGRRIVIDNTKIPYTITEQDSSGNIINDLYQYSDFTTQRFFNLLLGENKIAIEHEESNILKMAVEARLEYETV